MRRVGLSTILAQRYQTKASKTKNQVIIRLRPENIQVHRHKEGIEEYSSIQPPAKIQVAISKNCQTPG